MTNDPITSKAGQYLAFIIATRPYGVPIGSIREINRIGDIAPVPHSPACVAGVMNLRGKVIPVVNLRAKFGFPDVEHTKATCIIVIEGGSGPIGIIVDSVAGVIDFASDAIEPPPTMGEISRVDFIIGVGKQEKDVVILIDAVSALSKENLATKLVIDTPDHVA